MDRVGPTNPYHISRAYGVNNAGTSRVAPNRVDAKNGATTANVQSAPATFPIRKADQVGQTKRLDTVDATTARAAAAKQRISTLVAARVAEQPETSGATMPVVSKPAMGASGAATSGSFPMYRHPADKNAAATAIDAGRIIDVDG